MRIEMKDLAMGPEIRLESGKRYDVSDEFGQQLVDARHAVRVDDEADDEADGETASASVDGETASLKSRRKRG